MLRKILNRRTFLFGLGAGLGLSFLAGAASRSQRARHAVPLRNSWKYHSRHGGHHADEHPIGPAGRQLSARTKQLDPMAVLKSFDLRYSQSHRRWSGHPRVHVHCN